MNTIAPSPSKAKITLYPGQGHDQEVWFSYTESLETIAEVWTAIVPIFPTIFLREVLVINVIDGQQEPQLRYCLALPVTPQERQQTLARAVSARPMPIVYTTCVAQSVHDDGDTGQWRQEYAHDWQETLHDQTIQCMRCQIVAQCAMCLKELEHPLPLPDGVLDVSCLAHAGLVEYPSDRAKVMWPKV